MYWIWACFFAEQTADEDGSWNKNDGVSVSWVGQGWFVLLQCVVCRAVLLCSGLLQEPIKPHEVKVLNYLAHEYLLQRGNTMTAITLCEENSDQARGQSTPQGGGGTLASSLASPVTSPSSPPLPSPRISAGF